MVKKIYLLTKGYPSDEKFGLIQQMIKCAVSIPANVAEGVGRNTSKDTIQFLYISRGSLYELETYLILSSDLEYITEEESNRVVEEINECGKILNGLINHYEHKR